MLILSVVVIKVQSHSNTSIPPLILTTVNIYSKNFSPGLVSVPAFPMGLWHRLYGIHAAFHDTIRSKRETSQLRSGFKGPNGQSNSIQPPVI